MTEGELKQHWHRLRSRTPQPGDLRRHRETGDGYEVEGLCLRERDLVPCVLYSRIGCDGPLWCRPLDEFLSRFVEVGNDGEAIE